MKDSNEDQPEPLQQTGPPDVRQFPLFRDDEFQFSPDLISRWTNIPANRTFAQALLWGNRRQRLPICL